MVSFIFAKNIYFLDKSLTHYRIVMLNNCESTSSLYPFNYYRALLVIRFLKEKIFFSQLKENYKKLERDITIYNLNKNEENNILIYEELKRERFKNSEFNSIPSSKKFHEKYEKY